MMHSGMLNDSSWGEKSLFLKEPSLASLVPAGQETEKPRRACYHPVPLLGKFLFDDLQEGDDEVGIELRAGAFFQFSDGILDGHSLAVRPV
jgi:hypothetical protein